MPDRGAATVSARAVLGSLGLVATLLAGVAVARPDLLVGVGPLAGVVTGLSEVNLERLLLAASLGVGLYVSWTARSGSSARVLATDEAAAERFADALETPPETVTADEQALTGADLDAAMSLAVEGDDEALATVTERLRTLAAGAVEGDRDTAREAVAAGTWTDDRTAAAFLAGPAGPNYSLWSRIRLWLDPAAERERRIRATVAAVERGVRA